MILLQKENLFSFIVVLIYNVSYELLRLHMQFSHNSNNVLENHKTYENANTSIVPIFEESYCAYNRLGLVWILERFVNQI